MACSARFIRLHPPSNSRGSRRTKSMMHVARHSLRRLRGETTASYTRARERVNYFVSQNRKEIPDSQLARWASNSCPEVEVTSPSREFLGTNIASRSATVREGPIAFAVPACVPEGVATRRQTRLPQLASQSAFARLPAPLRHGGGAGQPGSFRLPPTWAGR